MPRLAIPEVFHPRLQFRYQVISSKIPGALIHARSAQQPGFDNSPVSVKFRSTNIMMKGRTVWNDITLSCYSFEGITENELFNYLNSGHINIESGVEKSMSDYKHLMQIFLLSPLGIPTGFWKLYGAFISNASWGNMDYGSNDVMQCDITISYDYAKLN